MRVLLIHNDYQQPGGETLVFEAEASLLQRAGHEVIFYRRTNEELRRAAPLKKLMLGLSVVYAPRAVREVRRLIRNTRPEVAHVHNVFPLISPAVYRVLAEEGVPVVQTLHNVRFLCPNGLFYTRGAICERCKWGNTLHAVRWRCYRNSVTASALYALSIGVHRRRGTFAGITRAIALTPFTVQKMVESRLFRADQLDVLGNFIPDPLPEARTAPPVHGYVAFLGRLSEEKGAHLLIEAARRLPDVPFRLAGDGPQREALERMARGLPNVELTGKISPDRRWAFLCGAALVVIPSTVYEAFSLAALEAMACGVPVIAACLGGLPYLVQDGVQGHLFTPGSAAELAERIRDVLGDPAGAHHMGQAGRRLVEERFTASHHLEGLMQIYGKAMTEEVRR